MSKASVMGLIGVFYILLGLFGSYTDEPEVMRAACYVIANIWIVGGCLK